MASDFNFLQQISQHFSSGPSYKSVSRLAGSKSPGSVTEYGSASHSDSDFEKTLHKTSHGAGSSIISNSYGRRQTHSDEGVFRNDLNSDEAAESIAHEQNLIGGASQIRQDSRAAIGDQGFDSQSFQLLQLLKKLGVEYLLSAENGNLLSSPAAGKHAALMHANGDEATLNSAVRQMDMAKLEALLKQFQTGAEAKTTAELQRIIDAFRGIVSDDAAGDTKSGPIAKTLLYTVAKPDAAAVVGASQHDSIRINPSAFMNYDKAAMAEVARNPASINSLLNALSNQIMSDHQNAQGGAEDKLLGARISPAAVLKGVDSADHLNPQSLSDASGQKQNNARGRQLNEGAGSATNHAGATLFSNLSATKVHNDSLSFKPVILTSDATSTLEIGNKIVNNDAAKDEGSLFSQHQNELKTSESHLLAKEAETIPKDIRSQTFDQIVQKAVLHLKNGRNEVQINLKPDFLGNLRMQIITESQQVTVRILAEFPMIKDLIETNIQQLKSDLQNCGLEIDELEVSVEHGSDQHVADQQKANGTNTANSAQNSRADEDTESERTAASRAGTLTSNENTTIDFFV
jgi:flagellar hook-length control protein FliK